MASKAAQKGLKYEPVEKIPDGGAERRGCNFWTSLSSDFSWADDFLHSRLAQIGGLDCLSPERHAVEIGRGSCWDAFPCTTRFGSCGNAGAVHLLIIHHHTAFSRDRKLHFPLLADFEPKGAVARLYGVYRETDGTTERALFVINELGVIHWSCVSPVGVNPGADGILSALEELHNKDQNEK